MVIRTYNDWKCYLLSFGCATHSHTTPPSYPCIVHSVNTGGDDPYVHHSFYTVEDMEMPTEAAEYMSMLPEFEEFQDVVDEDITEVWNKLTGAIWENQELQERQISEC